MTKKQSELYQVEHDYHVVGVGTLAQCQAVQRAMDKLQAVSREWIDRPGESNEQFLVLKSRTRCEVGPLERPVMSAEEFARESTIKLSHDPAVMAAGSKGVLFND